MKVGSSPQDIRNESLGYLQEQSLSVAVVPTDLLAYAGQAAELVETSIDKLHGVLLLDDSGFAITIVPVVRRITHPKNMRTLRTFPEVASNTNRPR